MSAITVIEICHGIWRADIPERAERRRTYVEEILSWVFVQPFTKEMGLRAARIDGEARRVGKVIPFADLQIGVTALEMGYAVVTMNVRHFAMIPGLVVNKFQGIVVLTSCQCSIR